VLETDPIEEAMMNPLITWQLNKIYQTEMLREAAERQTFRNGENARPNRPGPRLTLAFATCMVIVIPLVWIFAAR
jgi:hypothetical protein